MILLFNLLPRLPSFNIYNRTCLFQPAPATETAFDVLNRAGCFVFFVFVFLSFLCCFFLFFPDTTSRVCDKNRHYRRFKWDDSSNYFKKVSLAWNCSTFTRAVELRLWATSARFVVFCRSFYSAICNDILLTIIQRQPMVSANLRGANTREHVQNVPFPLVCVCSPTYVCVKS